MFGVAGAGAAEVGVAASGVGGSVSMAESGVDCLLEDRRSRATPALAADPFFDAGAMAQETRGTGDG